MRTRLLLLAALPLAGSLAGCFEIGGGAPRILATYEVAPTRVDHDLPTTSPDAVLTTSITITNVGQIADTVPPQYLVHFSPQNTEISSHIELSDDCSAPLGAGESCTITWRTVGYLAEGTTQKATFDITGGPTVPTVHGTYLAH
jgi:hypothetical protein